MVNLTPNQISNFMNKVIQSRNCWIWIGAKNQKGYGLFGLNGNTVRTHRISYELFKEDIPQGLTIDHLCRNKACINPDHLEAVTNKENVLRGDTITSKNSKKTHCPQGHIYSEENTRIHENERHCRVCNRICTKKWFERKASQQTFRNGK